MVRAMTEIVAELRKRAEKDPSEDAARLLQEAEALLHAELMERSRILVGR